MSPLLPPRAAVRREARPVRASQLRPVGVVACLLLVVAACAPAEGTGAVPATTATTRRSTPIRSGVETTPSTVHEDSSSSVLRRTPTAAEPLRAVVYGDSVSLTLGPATRQGLEKVACRNGEVQKHLVGSNGRSQVIRVEDGLHFSIYTVAPALGPWFADRFEELLRP